MKHSPLEPVAHLKISYTNGTQEVLGYGSSNEAMMAMERLFWVDGVKDVEVINVKKP